MPGARRSLKRNNRSGKPRVRPADLKDAGRIAQLSEQLGYPSTTNEMTGRIGLIMRELNHSVLVAEDESGSVVGWIHAVNLFHLESGAFAEIVGLVVDEAHRGKGIGKHLVEGAEAWSRSMGCTTIMVRSNVLRNHAVKFYENIGYPRLKQQNVFRKSLR